ncbi:MAG: hypothetical protein ACLUF8_12445 [Clostridium sp.]
MGFFSNAKDNYDKRQRAAEYRYDARKYINEGKEIYEKLIRNISIYIYSEKE